ncbi:MAG: SDR family oxidoreductase [Rhizobiales bacterium]|nr:SDR family oxidoreductase [Hyphomicrobiales bacterium]MBO6700652.1 SDR family oxidoreductase [Hyphomicrobiales bacterium]MBO6738188.1 SDR family oxidoreductase [Hyphomicrobiales bacterium]MBO6913505.1 SDR family oxidoreductase [Hyphomicrobiales bacterium]MBO6955326.1 SDR family oxidoreductase [Hyphomicrobiales bacterium]
MRLLIIGYGYSSKAIHAALDGDLESLTVTRRTPEKAERLRANGLDAVLFDGNQRSPDLDQALASATHLIMSAAPGEAGDPLLTTRDLAIAANLQWAGYLSTVGVYGNHDGAWVDEDTPTNPQSKRSKQRVAAEESWLALGASAGIKVGVFRLAGIYGPGRSALDKVRDGTARRIVKPDQVFNRIHVDDIGRVVAAAAKQDAGGVFNVTDDEPGPPQDVIAHAAELLGVEPPPEVVFDEADLSPMGRSFYGENKRVSNAKIKQAFGPMLYPTYREGLAALRS